MTTEEARSTVSAFKAGAWIEHPVLLEALEIVLNESKQAHKLKCELGRLKTNAKNKERARRRKDNYINRLQNQLIAIKDVNKKRNQQLEQVRETLEFYADEQKYEETVKTTYGYTCEIAFDEGTKARQTLEEIK